MSRDRMKQMILFSGEVGTSADLKNVISLKKPIRIVRVWAVPEVAQAAHATVLMECMLGTVADPDAYVHLTNDSDLSDSDVIVTSAWAANTVKEKDYEDDTSGTEDRPGSYKEIAAGLIQARVVKSGSTPDAGRVTFGMDYYESD